MSYIAAKNEQTQIDLYGMDLVWLMAKRYYDDLPQPSELYFKKTKRDTRSAKQIKEDIIKHLGGE